MDSLTDKKEISIGSNPKEKDSDKDGVPDGLEIIWNLNPLISDSTQT